MPIRPFVGVGAVTTAQQARTLIGAWPRYDSRHLLMIGVYAAGTGNFPIHWPDRFPEEHEAGKIFQDDPRCLNIIQLWTNYRHEMVSQIRTHADQFGPHVGGCQINATWPEPIEFEKLRAAYPKWKLILQVGQHAIDEVGGHPDVIAECLRDKYLGLVDYAVIDQTGCRFVDEDFLVNCAHACDDKLGSNMGVGVSGGYDSSNVGKLAPVSAACGWHLSICGNGRLRGPYDALNMEKALAFIQNARLAAGALTCPHP